MSECIKCGAKFIGTAANPPPDGLCRYCERDSLKEQLKEALNCAAEWENESIGQAEDIRRLSSQLSIAKNTLGQIASDKKEFCYHSELATNTLKLLEKQEEKE